MILTVVHFDTWGAQAAGLTAIMVFVGVMWAKVLRPLAMAAKKNADLYQWLQEEFAARNGEGKLRDQVNRIEQAQTGQAVLIERLMNGFDELTTKVDGLTVTADATAGVVKDVQRTIDDAVDPTTGENPIIT